MTGPDDTTEFWRDPAMPCAESRRACRSRAAYRPHSHPTWSIGAVAGGASVFTGAGPAPVALHPGTLVIVPPGHVHACNPAPDSAWSYQMLHLDPGWVAAICAEEGADALGAVVRVTQRPAHYQAFCRLNALLFSDASVPEKEAALILFVGDALRLTGQTIDTDPPGAAVWRQRLAAVFAALASAPVEGRQLAELAALAGLSRYQLIRAFRRATGMTPHAWQVNQRVNLARDRLRAGEAIAEVAYGLGFADQSHFQRVFKAHAAVTPARYRA